MVGTARPGGQGARAPAAGPFERAARAESFTARSDAIDGAQTRPDPTPPTARGATGARRLTLRRLLVLRPPAVHRRAVRRPGPPLGVAGPAVRRTRRRGSRARGDPKTHPAKARPAAGGCPDRFRLPPRARAARQSGGPEVAPRAAARAASAPRGAQGERPHERASGGAPPPLAPATEAGAAVKRRPWGCGRQGARRGAARPGGGAAGPRGGRAFAGSPAARGAAAARRGQAQGPPTRPGCPVRRGVPIRGRGRAPRVRPPRPSPQRGSEGAARAAARNHWAASGSPAPPRRAAWLRPLRRVLLRRLGSSGGRGPAPWGGAGQGGTPPGGPARGGPARPGGRGRWRGRRALRAHAGAHARGPRHRPAPAAFAPTDAPQRSAGVRARPRTAGAPARGRGRAARRAPPQTPHM
jgi:hypothetical protein